MFNPKDLPRLLVTMGEPAGIGPELIVRAAQHVFSCQLIAIADGALLSQTAAKLKLPLEIVEFDPSAPAKAHQPGRIALVRVDLPAPVKTGSLDAKNAQATLQMLDTAHQMAMEKQVDALITGPVHKAILNQVNSTFHGHTEYFAKLAGGEHVVMMLATDDLRVCLQTTHLPLRNVADAITHESLCKTIDTIVGGFSQLGLADPKIAVCGLNPHAGENGLLGAEDDEIIAPVIQKYQQNGIIISGPHPADSLFTKAKRPLYDVFLAMYHDQGLPVVKAAGFGQCANITLGLPYIRTSVDHGTALDIAASFSASADSLVYAINYAQRLANGKLPS